MKNYITHFCYETENFYMYKSILIDLFCIPNQKYLMNMYTESFETKVLIYIFFTKYI